MSRVCRALSQGCGGGRGSDVAEWEFASSSRVPPASSRPGPIQPSPDRSGSSIAVEGVGVPGAGTPATCATWRVTLLSEPKQSPSAPDLADPDPAGAPGRQPGATSSSNPSSSSSPAVGATLGAPAAPVGLAAVT